MQDTPFDGKRLGIHYFPDIDHYGKSDIERWLPILKSLGVQWLSLKSPSERAIPEEFLAELQSAGIQPLIHMPLSLEVAPSADEIAPILAAYGQRGVRYISFFDRPNLRSSWPSIGWTQRNLVERFLEIFLPLAHLTIDTGLTPLFPPLEPGGDYWDTAFLRAALEELQSRGEGLLLEQMGLSAYSLPAGKELDWGIGGPEAWPASLPYSTPEGSQDQRGFRIFDWYNAIARATVGNEMPLFIIGSTGQNDLEANSKSGQKQFIEMAKQVANTNSEDDSNTQLVPDNVMALNFWLLASSAGSAEESKAWFDADGNARDVVADWQAWANKSESLTRIIHQSPKAEKRKREHLHEAELDQLATPKEMPNDSSVKSFGQYLLLPTYDWGASDLHFEAIKAFMLKQRPTVGYSIEEAKNASQVILLGGEEAFSQNTIEQLNQAGCSVDQIQGDGTTIASQLALL